MKLLNGLAPGQVLQRRDSSGAFALLVGTTLETGVIVATIKKRGGPLRGWKERRVGRAEKGKFTARLEGIPTGGPYRLELRVKGGREVVLIPSFFVGDVWVLAGQSNMEGCGNREGAARSHPLIHSFSMRREWRLAVEPLHVKAESPDPCHSDRQCTRQEAERQRRKERKGVGPGLYFAHEMLKRSGIPQALICTAHGGTSMTQWDPAEKRKEGASLYGSLLLSVRGTGQPVAGVLWYQGESDATDVDALLYRERMRRLVAATRRDLGQPRLPWVIVQIARVFDQGANKIAWNRIQEEQRILPDRIVRLETVSAIDLPLDDHIHIGAEGHLRLGARLARITDLLACGNRREVRPPRLKAIGVPRHDPKTNSTVVDVRFDHVVGGLRAQGEPNGFALVDADGEKIDIIYKIALLNATARLYLKSPPDSLVRLSYGHGLTPVCNITDDRDFSVPVFGPLAFQKPRADLPFILRWKKTGVLPAARPLSEITFPDIEAWEATVHDYFQNPYSGLVNEHAFWKGKSGHAFFASRIDLPEPMKLEVLMGYDGPFRLWIDGQPFFTDINGINPCIADQSRKKVRLAQGIHTLHIAMDINRGLAWGFMLRFRRLGLTPTQIRSKNFVQPTYST